MESKFACVENVQLCNALVQEFITERIQYLLRNKREPSKTNPRIARKQLPVGLGDDLAGLAAPVKEFPTMDGTGKKGSPRAIHTLLKQIDESCPQENESVVGRGKVFQY